VILVDRVLAARPAPSDVSTTVAALDAARLDLAVASAARALGTATEAELRDAADALTKARQAHEAAVAAAEQADMTRAGLDCALAQDQADVDAAAVTRREAEVEWLCAQQADADKAYGRAADAFFAAWRRAKEVWLPPQRRQGRRSSYTEVAPPPMSPSLGAWRDIRAHQHEMFRVQASDWSGPEVAPCNSRQRRRSEGHQGAAAVLLRVPLPVADATEGVLPKSAVQPAAESSERTRTETHFTEHTMTRPLSLPLSVKHASAFVGFLWRWSRAVDPSTIELCIIEGELWTRNSRGWASLGDVAGWLRLAVAIGALRSK
jgi:hypothetical protein